MPILVWKKMQHLVNLFFLQDQDLEYFQSDA